MAVIETWLDQDLQKPVQVKHLDGNLFSNNGNGNRIGVAVYNNGEPVTLTGTVSGYAIVADGSTVPCTGARSGNKASILIPPAAYLPGAIFISIFLTDGTTVTTLAAIASTVMQTRTNNQVSPGSVVQDWTQTINAAMQSVEDAAENLGGIIATPYASLTYPVPLGKYTYYNNGLYRCISPIAASEEFTAAHWTQVKLGDDVSDLKSAIIQDGLEQYKEFSIDPSVTNIAMIPFQFVVGRQYEIISSGVSGAWNAFTNNGSQNIETIATSENVNSGAVITPTLPANTLRVVANAAMTFKIWASNSIQENVLELNNEKLDRIEYKNRIDEILPSKTYAFHIETGKTYECRNVSKAEVGVNVLASKYSNGTYNMIAQLPGSTSVVTFVAQEDTDYIKISGNNTLEIASIRQINTIDERILSNKNRIYFPNIHDETTDTYGKAINSSGVVVDTNGYHITDYIYIGNNTTFSSLWQNHIQAIALYDKNKQFVRRVEPYMYEIKNVLTTGDNEYYIRLNIITKSLDNNVMVNLGNTLLDFVPYGVPVYGSDAEYTGKMILESANVPAITFDFDHTMKDLSSIVSGFDFTNLSRQADVLEQVYAKFDGLVSAYPDYVSKVDAAIETGLTYPEYANGNYDSTPQYKTYLYKLVFQSDTLNTARYKKKVFLVSGTHGNEIAAPVNVYLFAKQLCESTDPNYYKLRSAFDFYIIPCLNGYGMYNLTRGNGNKVDLNRNYPVRTWRMASEDTKDSPTGNSFTGYTAGSEFETQLVMAETALIKPDMAFDCHNYSNSTKIQFYLGVHKTEFLPIAYDAAADCSFTFIKNEPQYFGSKFNNFASGDAPGKLDPINWGSTARWWHENAINISATIEVSECINYINGEKASTGQDPFGATLFSVDEYTLRRIILGFGRYAMDKTILK